MRIDQNPLAPEIEQAFLGALLIKQKAIAGVSHLVSEDDFHHPAHGKIFAVMKSDFAAGRATTPHLLGERFLNDPDFSFVGGKDYFVGLANSAGALFAIDDYAKAIANINRLRKLQYACQDVMLSVEQNPMIGAGGLVSEHIHRCEKILFGGGADNIQRNDVVEEIIATEATSPRLVYRTGIPMLDAAMGGGLHAGKSYGFAARKKVGKTILASTLSFNLNQNHIPHLFICGEMGSKEIHSRTLCRAFEIEARTMREGGEDLAKRIRVYSSMAPKFTYYHDAPGLRFNDLQNAVTAAHYEHGIKGFILDYWQLVGGKDRSQSTAEHLESVAQWIADFSRKNGLWSVVMAQINQDGNTRGSEGMRLAFDQVYALERDPENLASPEAWLDMMDTRYTPWCAVGSKNDPSLLLCSKGPYFKPIETRRR